MRIVTAIVMTLIVLSGATDAQALDLKESHFVQNCNILTISGKELKALPGVMCLFLDDGSFLSASHLGLKLIDRSNNVKWELKGHFHHQLVFSHDRKRILAIASEEVEVNGEKQRGDKFLVVDLEGRVLHELSAQRLLGLAKQELLHWANTPWLKAEVKMEREISHFNSFYEIPPLDKVSRVPGLKEKNYVVNGLSQGLFIVSQDLKELLYHKVLETSKKHFVHDVQVRANGNILYFNNVSSEASELDLFSTVDEYDLEQGKTVFQFSSRPRSMFYSRICGSVQEIDNDHLLFTDQFNGTYIYSKKLRNIVYTLRGTHFRNRLPILNQHTKALDLSRFLKSRN